MKLSNASPSKCVDFHHRRRRALLILSVQVFCGTPTAFAWVSTPTSVLTRRCPGTILAHPSPQSVTAALRLNNPTQASSTRRRDAGPVSTHAAPEVMADTWRAVRLWAVSLMIVLMTSSFSPFMSLAENELAEFADGKFNSDLVSSECFATSCKAPTKACFEDGDCKKGLMCTARCLGDSACITGCFSRFGNDILNNLLQCSIEDYKCIKIAIMKPGNDAYDEVPPAPKPLLQSFDPKSLQGRWYKVLGSNRQYDCFECQANTFDNIARSNAPDGPSGGVSADVDVEFSMLSRKAGREARQKPLTMRENIIFDTPLSAKSKRTAHTEGRMFGLTFWENWYLIGENTPSEPEFKFVYYTGKTLQNRYNGAFVYARTPELPKETMASVYEIAQQAGLNPTKFCKIQNQCFDDPNSAYNLQGTNADAALSSRHPVEDKPAFWYDVLDYTENPSESARWMFNQQQKMTWEDMKPKRQTKALVTTPGES
eukprot:CAMPEP_0185748102 /NCGR_PEP_ID=MMETSP1174-20130828/6763_1 /TAXON_ID=35687 /ORGANISM="Dictyocha speculum, Strain CCMP1381" /LENGTH=483 /DNA_ID=CAMNT_0028423601 /DNA_START=90 /DNA_END=1538 /DNA_ORIENTATION=-